jgi:hypothetical protein
MSRGPGKIESAIAALFVRLGGTDVVLSVTDLCRHVFGESQATPTRSQRISVLRATHRVLSRMRQKEKDDDSLLAWRMTELSSGRVVFHDRCYPVRVWAVQIYPQGVVWAEAKIVKITKARVNVLYDGELASLDRYQLGLFSALWRGVYFVSAQSGHVASWFENVWRDHYGHLFPTPPKLPLEEAKRLSWTQSGSKLRRCPK